MALLRIFPNDDKGFHCFLLIRSGSPLLLYVVFFIVKLYTSQKYSTMWNRAEVGSL